MHIISACIFVTCVDRSDVFDRFLDSAVGSVFFSNTKCLRLSIHMYLHPLDSYVVVFVLHFCMFWFSPCTFQMRICAMLPAPGDIRFRLHKQTICRQFIHQSKLLQEKDHKIGDCWIRKPDRHSHETQGSLQHPCSSCQWWEEHEHLNCHLVRGCSSIVPVDGQVAEWSGGSIDADLKGLDVSKIL